MLEKEKPCCFADNAAGISRAIALLLRNCIFSSFNNATSAWRRVVPKGWGWKVVSKTLLHEGIDMPVLLKIYYKSFIYYRSLLGNLELTVIFFMKTPSAEFPLVSYLSNIYKRFYFKINLIEIRGY